MSVKKQPSDKKKGGFALLSKKKLREISVKGGKANTNRHKFTRAEAVKYGRKGGLASAKAKAKAKMQDGFDESDHQDY